MKYKRIFVIVMDSAGIGAMKDADKFGDEGTNTWVHTSERCGGLDIPTINALGIGDLGKVVGSSVVSHPHAYSLILNEASNGKDTMTGHWEMMGILTTKPFKTFTDTGFPKELIDELEEKTGRKIIGNIAASGTEIIKQLGEEQMKTGALIVYTSADSVLQIAAHESIIPLSELYRDCEIARDICMRPEYLLGRIIARPYVGDNKDNFKRTSNRHDYALSPTGTTAMNILKDAGYEVSCVGKINDIFDGVGINKQIKATNNTEAINKLTDIIDKNFTGLCMVNLCDFDALYGHTRDVDGYGRAIEELDVDIPMIINKLDLDDLLIVTADHGNDPTFVGNGHTRENLPVIIYSRNFKNPKRLPQFSTLANIGATIADNFDLTKPEIGESILDELD